MNIFKRSQFLELADVHAVHCVSIYITTHRVSTPDNLYKDKMSLKNRIKEAEAQLRGYGLSEQESHDYLAKAYELVEDEVFWSHCSDGLALFLYNGDIQYHTLPSAFDEFTYVSTHLYLKPLVEFLHGEGRHFIMALSLGNVHFYEATRHTITEVNTEGLIPEALEEAVGTDYEQKTLQYRSGQGERGNSAGIFHGHGSGNDSERKMEAQKYFRAINDGLMQMLHDEKAPLVIACVDYLYPIYKETNHYKYLSEKHISGNHDKLDIMELKERAWEIVKDGFEQERATAKDKYELLLSGGKAAFNPEEVIPGAIIGRAETLFLKRGALLWGTYDKNENKVHIDQIQKTNNAELLNKAAVETIKNAGEVYILEEADMPDSTTPANAVFRYQM
ncbi:hypothetical protein C900_05243 [Fulvivirga imtechensis AK7]|uniref:Uncharacterized protein n=1 Tax=Fulvivirga imtechensis AK7 TaxID=1237149 RepID=L8JZT0_9BACT|nr:hypothetical protein [Fulvivirga imtechensis]ELR73194.1 hypothetical protein C900_05243 [Fulvivirga imtechensis AK7]